MFVFVKEMLVNVIRKSHVLRFLARKAKASSHGDICGFSERYRVLKVWHIYNFVPKSKKWDVTKMS